MGQLVSILIPCYNAHRWIAQAIKSALAQTWPSKEQCCAGSDGMWNSDRQWSSRRHRGVHTSGCAILCEPRSSQMLTEAVLRLYKQPSLVESIGAAARTRTNELAWPLVAERTVQLYEKVLNGSLATALEW